MKPVAEKLEIATSPDVLTLLAVMLAAAAESAALPPVKLYWPSVAAWVLRAARAVIRIIFLVIFIFWLIFFGQ